MGDKDGMESGAEGWIDVGLGAVADHPGCGSFAGVMGGEGEVCLIVFFRQDLDGGKMGSEAGAVEFVGLFGRVALGDEDEAVACGKIGEGLGYAGQQLDLLIGDRLGEADDALMLLRRDGGVCELLEAGNERAAEAA